MAFSPSVNQGLQIGSVTYRVAEHPAAPGIPYGQEGRAATVYQLLAADGTAKALKVFKSRFRLPTLVSVSERLRGYASIAGLSVCERTVLSPEHHATLLRQHLDLTYAVLMPWISGPTWMQVLTEKQQLTCEQSLALARGLAQVLSGMEQQGLAHCDLSGPNLVLPALAGGRGVELVDVEQMYGPDLHRPANVLSGSSGYAHTGAAEAAWSADADRFAGAVLIAEILGWCDPKVRSAAWGESYFDPGEMQKDSERLKMLVTSLRAHWGDRLAELFELDWLSDTTSDCATFGEWLVALPDSVPPTTPGGAVDEETECIARTIHRLLQLAQSLQEQGHIAAARQVCQHAREMSPAGAATLEEIDACLRALDASPAIATARQSEERNGLHDAIYAGRDLRWKPAPITPGNAAQVDWMSSVGLGGVSGLAWLQADSGLQLAVAFYSGLGIVALNSTSLECFWKTKADEINTVVALPDQKQALFGTEQGMLGLWHITGYQPRASVNAGAGISCIAVHPAGRMAAAGLYNGHIKTFRLPGLRVLSDWDTGTAGEITSIVFEPQGNQLAVGTERGEIQIWQSQDGTRTYTIDAHDGAVWALRYSPDGSILASGGEDEIVKVRTMPDDEESASMQDACGAIMDLAFNPRGNMLATGSHDGLVRLWSVEDASLVKSLEGHRDWVLTVSFSPEGNLLASGSSDGIVHIWGVT